MRALWSSLWPRLVLAGRDVVRQPRPAEMAFAALLLFALLFYLPLRMSFGDVGASAGRQSAPPPQVWLAEVDPKGELGLPTPPYTVRPTVERPQRRNLFAYLPRPTVPPTPIPVTPTPPTTPPPTPPPPTPTPYDCPYTVVGIVRQLEPGKSVAFLKAGEDVVVALEGDILSHKTSDGRMQKHRVIKVGLETVDIGPFDFEASVRLKLGS